MKSKKKSKDKVGSFLVEFNSYGIGSQEGRLFTVVKEAHQAAEKWVGKNEQRSATLKVFNAKGKLKATLKYGPERATEFLWSEQPTRS